jgi:hypothetical protein
MPKRGYAAAIGSAGGCAIYRSLSVLATGLVVKASPGRVYGWHLSNSGAAAAHVKFYDKATAATQADTPVMTLRLAAGASYSLDLGPGIGFSAGIGVRAVTEVADNGTTAPGANEVVANIFFA